MKHHYLTGFSIEPQLSPLAYLISVAAFHQSSVYLLPVADGQDLPSKTRDITLVLTRFKPDNLAHVIHDDILPVYASLARVTGHMTIPYDVRIGFADDYGVMAYDSLYQKLTSHDLAYNISMRDSCFEELIVGFDKSTFWYQYGFSIPQGPVPHDSSMISRYIRSFTAEDQAPANGSHIVILSRTETRLILNEAQLSISLAKKFSKTVKLVSLELYSLEEIASMMSAACLVVGMHGALMSSMIWMPPDSCVLELFPYAVNPDHYTPYKTLANILGIRYMSWQNRDLTQTVGHADWPCDVGGLGHLSDSQRQNILSQSEVPRHVCCDDPSWLYHIYQDTYADIHDIMNILHQG